MKLNGTVRAAKRGVFSPDDDPSNKIAWAHIVVRDDDTGDVVKVKPPQDELEEFLEVTEGLKKGDAVSFTVSADIRPDGRGTIRLVLPSDVE